MSASSLAAPRTAWPTVVLTVLAVAALATSIAMLAIGAISTLSASALSTIAVFVAFTPMHDASHRSVSRNRKLNTVIGRLSSFALIAPFAAFRFVHLQHHRHTNDPKQDPDYYAGSGPQWLLPMCWLTQDLHYYVLILRTWKARSRAERTEIVAHFLITGIVIALLVAAGHGDAVLFAWILPARIAIGALSFAFDYLPHVPHQVPASEDRYAATRVIEAPGLTPLLLYQNYHLIHHLYPGVPFYRYRKIFDERESELVSRGARITRFGTSRRR